MNARSADILIPTRLGCIPRPGAVPESHRDSVVALEALRALAESLLVLEQSLRQIAAGRPVEQGRLDRLRRRATELERYATAAESDRAVADRTHVCQQRS